jgi:hypothetical protein
VPVIVADTIAYVVSRSLRTFPYSICSHVRTDSLLPSLEEEREETILRIEDAMLPAPSVILNAEDYVADAERRVQDTPQDIFLIRVHPINAPFRWPLPGVDVVSDPSHVLNHYSWTHSRPPSLY